MFMTISHTCATAALSGSLAFDTSCPCIACPCPLACLQLAAGLAHKRLKRGRRSVRAADVSDTLQTETACVRAAQTWRRHRGTANLAAPRLSCLRRSAAAVQCHDALPVRCACRAVLDCLGSGIDVAAGDDLIHAFGDQWQRRSRRPASKTAAAGCP